MTRLMAVRSASALAFLRSPMPAPTYTTRPALSGWSRPSGTTISGTPAISAFITVPCPPWVITAEQCGSTSAWRTQRVGRPLQEPLLAHDGAAQAHQHQRLARLTCPPLAGTFARVIVELGPDIAHIGRHRAGPEVVAGAGADQDPVRPGHQAGQAPHRRQPHPGADPVEGRHPAAEDRQRDRRRRTIT